jgi:rhodanese-related sulfurtransferase
MMPIFFSVLLVLLVALVALNSLPLAAQDQSGRIDSDELEKLIAEKSEDYILVDVRTKQEYESGYIPTAINIPHREIGENPPTDDRSAKIILYCRSGNRSNIARETLEKLGFSNVIDFGGINRWEGELREIK